MATTVQDALRKVRELGEIYLQSARYVAGNIKTGAEVVAEKIRPPLLSPIPEGSHIQAQETTPPPSPTPDPYAEIERKIRAGLIQYGGEDLPALQYVPQMVEATRRYDFFKNNPFLLPQLTILETSGGRNITRPNNLLNWGINYPGNNAIFATMEPSAVFERAISGMGERSPYYHRVRRDNNLEEFAKIYEPANQDYYTNLMEGIKVFEGL